MAKETEGSALGNEILAQRIAASLLIGKSGRGENAHEMLNSFNIKKERKKVVKAHYDKLGQTIPASGAILEIDAERNIRHSRMLASNINKANFGQVRPQWVDAHHIVGQSALDAAIARRYLFNWGIGINDADNGVYLPRYASSVVPSMPNAPHHQAMHTKNYYFNVTMRLQDVVGQPVSIAREVLREIKGELIAGTFR